MNMRSRFFVPFAKGLHELIHHLASGVVPAVDIQIHPGITHGSESVGNVVCMIEITHAMCNCVTEGNYGVILPQVKLFNGIWHHGQEQAVVSVRKWKAIDKGCLYASLVQRCICKDLLVIYKCKYICLGENLQGRKKHLLGSSERR